MAKTLNGTPLPAPQPALDPEIPLPPPCEGNDCPDPCPGASGRDLAMLRSRYIFRTSNAIIATRRFKLCTPGGVTPGLIGPLNPAIVAYAEALALVASTEYQTGKIIFSSASIYPQDKAAYGDTTQPPVYSTTALQCGSYACAPTWTPLSESVFV